MGSKVFCNLRHRPGPKRCCKLPEATLPQTRVLGPGDRRHEALPAFEAPGKFFCNEEGCREAQACSEEDPGVWGEETE